MFENIAGPVTAIFAHPDDESFGPGGTLALLADKHPVEIICATRGEQGLNHSGAHHDHISAIRSREVGQAAEILGIQKVHFLDFIDGTLCNKLYHEVADKVERILNASRPQTLITYEPLGVSGHLDHIAMSLITTFVARRSPFVRRVLYFCVSREESGLIKDYFIYFPPGLDREKADLRVDIAPTWERKVRAIKAHRSQNKDVRMILENLEKLPREELFLELSVNELGP